MPVITRHDFDLGAGLDRPAVQMPIERPVKKNGSPSHSTITSSRLREVGQTVSPIVVGRADSRGRLYSGISEMEFSVVTDLLPSRVPTAVSAMMPSTWCGLARAARVCGKTRRDARRSANGALWTASSISRGRRGQARCKWTLPIVIPSTWPAAFTAALYRRTAPNAPAQSSTAPANPCIMRVLSIQPHHKPHGATD